MILFFLTTAIALSLFSRAHPTVEESKKKHIKVTHSIRVLCISSYDQSHHPGATVPHVRAAGIAELISKQTTLEDQVSSLREVVIGVDATVHDTLVKRLRKARGGGEEAGTEEEEAGTRPHGKPRALHRRRRADLGRDGGGDVREHEGDDIGDPRSAGAVHLWRRGG